MAKKRGWNLCGVKKKRNEVTKGRGIHNHRKSNRWSQWSWFWCTEFIEKFIGVLGYILFMRWIVFLEFSENNGKSGKDYKSQVGICFTCRMNCPILPHFYRILGKMQKTGTKIDDKLRCIPLTGWILRIYPVFPELIQQTENRGEDWLWHQIKESRLFYSPIHS